MPKVKVINDATHDWKEDFKGDPIFIPAGGYILMERRDAIQFRGQWAPEVKDGLERTIRSKNLRLEQIGVASSFAENNNENKYVSNLNGAIFNSKEELEEHYKENGHLSIKIDEIEEQKTTTPTAVYVCDICDTEFKNKLELITHKESHNDSSTSKSPRKKPNRRTNSEVLV